ncbi:hypothetical protein D3C71_1887620 [compost metagenome]
MPIRLLAGIDIAEHGLGMCQDAVLRFEQVGLGHDGGGRVQLPVVATSWNAIAGKSS